MKQEIIITRRIVFHAGHMLKDDKSKCYNPHGHEYVLDCSIIGPIQEEGEESGMVMNFGSLKELMMRKIHDVYDHKFIIETSDPRKSDFIKAVGFDGIRIHTFAPTAENLACFFSFQIDEELTKGVRVHKVRLQETLNCWAEYYPVEN